MGLRFRRRDYRAEEQANSTLRTPADNHPLSFPSPSPIQVEEPEGGRDDFFDPLRSTNGTMEVSVYDMQHEDINSDAAAPSDIRTQQRARKEWSSFKKILMQRFPISKTSPICTVSSVLVKVNRGQLDDSEKISEEDIKVISQREYLSKLQELKDEINESWRADDRVTSLRLSIK